MPKQISYEEAVIKARRYVHWLVDCPKCGAPSPTIKPDPGEADWGWCEQGKHRFATYAVRLTKEGEEVWPEGFPWQPPEGFTLPAGEAKGHGH